MHEDPTHQNFPLGLPAPAVNVLEAPPEGRGEKQTARRAISILVEKGLGFHNPRQIERDALVVAFAMRRKVLYGAAFDVVRMAAPFDLSDVNAILANLDKLTIYEIKSTNKPQVKPDLRGYFCDLTTAELLVAQSLGKHYQFAFVNTLTGTHLELSLTDIFARARKIYPKWAIAF